MKRVLCVVISLLLILSLFVGCGEDAKTGSDKGSSTSEHKKKDDDKKSDDEGNDPSGEHEEQEHQEHEINGEIKDYLVAELVGTIDTDKFHVEENGLYYLEDGKYGILSYSGMKDTGAVFEEKLYADKCNQVYRKAVASDTDYDGLNSSVLINGNCQILTPEGMTFSILSDRYIQVFLVTELTFNTDECLTSRNDEIGTCFIGTYGNTKYKGYWYIYDAVLDRPVPNLTDTKDSSMSASGRFIAIRDADYNWMFFDENGESVNINTLFDDGYYSANDKVYDESGKLMFEYKRTEYVPVDYYNGLFIGEQYADGEYKYVLMDTTGKIVSDVFNGHISVLGEIVLCGGSVYNLEGKKVLDGSFEYAYIDPVFGQYYLLQEDKFYTMIDKNGTVYFESKYDDEYHISTNEFLFSKGTDEYKYYSFKDKDYTLKGWYFAPWILETEGTNYLYSLVDVMSGNVLIEGYKRYRSVSKNSEAYFVYAEYEGTTDIYLVTSSAIMQDIETKKEDLFAELAEAFKNEGINVSIDRESGEIALDASILFGGDSAELTNDGKAFLKKFIKAYATVVQADKYKNFIAKTMIEGHTAPLATSTYESGLPLSQERAKNVKEYCLSSETGVDVSGIKDSFEDIGYSNSKPIYNENGEVDLAACRRVSFRFLVDVDD